MTETIGVVSHTERGDVARPASPSWFIAKINPVSRFIGALILLHPHVLHARYHVGFGGVRVGNAAAMDRRHCAVDGVAQDLAGVDRRCGKHFVSVALYGKTSGVVLANLGGFVW